MNFVRETRNLELLYRLIHLSVTKKSNVCYLSGSNATEFFYNVTALG